ncbi:MAG: S26 family signal peptidase [Pelagibacterium sp. SCN 64-44]|nr:MAG: S26 family signal peptidase [Pelagibacterium sp. SCN 64-44]
MRRGLTLISMLTGCALIAAPAVSRHGPRFIWNTSASVPVGLYRVEPAGRIEVTDLVALLAPEPLARFLAERGYLPHGALLIKRVLALPGTEVCRRGLTIIAYDHAYGEARARDSAGRPLPSWQGCQVVGDGEVFLMNWHTPDSFDGRYFGLMPLTSVTARLTPIWTDDDGDGRFDWRAGLPFFAPSSPQPGEDP